MGDTDDPDAGQGGPDEHPDDFTVIPGVGPAINRRLHEAGVDRFRDLAALDNDRVAGLLAGIPALSPEKISNADWVGRAAMLAHAVETNGQSDADADDDPGIEGERVPGHDSFVLRVITRPGRLPRVQLQDVRTGVERQALGLDRLPELVAGLLSPDDPVPATPAPTAAPPAPAGPDGGREPQERPAGISVGLRTAARVVREDEPFTVETLVDLGGTVLRSAPQFSVSVFARSMGRGQPHHLVVRGAGRLDVAVPHVTLLAGGLAAGTYRLESVVELTDQAETGPVGRVAGHYAETILVVVPGDG